MGSWGVGLFRNVGLDVRGTYRDCRKMGFRGDEQAAIVLDGAAIGDAPAGEDEINGYLALADLLWKDGMLPTAMRETALRLTAAPALLEPWEDARDRRKQAALLAALAKRPAAPQPAAPAPGTPSYIEQCDFGIGEIIAYPHPDSAWTLLRVIAYWTRFRGRSPVCEVLDRERAAGAGGARGHRLQAARGAADLGRAAAGRTCGQADRIRAAAAGATWGDYEDQMIAPHIHIIRRSEPRPAFP